MIFNDSVSFYDSKTSHKVLPPKDSRYYSVLLKAFLANPQEVGCAGVEDADEKTKGEVLGMFGDFILPELAKISYKDIWVTPPCSSGGILFSCPSYTTEGTRSSTTREERRHTRE